MKYVDGFVLVVPKSKRGAYRKMAKEGAQMWMKHGALEYFECVADDMSPPWIKLTFPKLTKARKGEEVWFSFIVYKSKAHRDDVNKKVMKGMQEWEKKNGKMKMPFDMNKMAYGGFKVIVEK